MVLFILGRAEGQLCTAGDGRSFFGIADVFPSFSTFPLGFCHLQKKGQAWSVSREQDFRVRRQGPMEAWVRSASPGDVGHVSPWRILQGEVVNWRGEGKRAARRRWIKEWHPGDLERSQKESGV